jgi:GT2 family glycosyltransferase
LSTDLSIITVNYNSGAFLLGCLRAVFENTRDVELEYLIVDNASRKDGTLDAIRAEFPQVRLFENATNVGFAAGCNVALAHARGRYVLLLNPDTAVRPHALDQMMQFMDSRPDVAVLGSPLVYADGRDQGVAGRGFPTPLAFLFGRTTLLTKLFPGNRFSARFSSKRDPNRCEPYEVDWVSGACMMVRRDAIEQVGHLDPGYFFMWEDADWCFQIKRAGWKVYCFHEANVVHCEGGSRNREWRALWLATVAFHTGAYRYYRKHINPRALDPTHLLVMMGLAARSVLILAIRSIKRLGSSAPGDPKPANRNDQGLDSQVVG